MSEPKGGLVFSGGGARGAYQAGVLKGLAKLNRDNPQINPFRIITGVSAGAVNSTFMAASTEEYTVAADRLCDLWGSLHTDKIFKADSFSLFANALRVMRTLVFSGKGKGTFSGGQLSLLNTEPSLKLFGENIDFSGIQRNIDAGRLDALALSATDYATSFGITFVQGKPGMPMWQRSDRYSVESPIELEHLMASSAIPIFFPASKIKNRYFGDGCLRNTAPLSPAIRLGATKLLVIGVRKGLAAKPDLGSASSPPGIGKIMNTMINAVMMDAMEMDMERMLRVNHTLSKISAADRHSMSLHPIASVHIRPSIDISELAKSEHGNLPKGLRYLLSGLGSVEETSDIVSYLLFEGSFCRKLIDLGYQDCLAKHEEITKIFLAP